MSYLGRLKAKIAEDPSDGFVGDQGTPVSPSDPSGKAFVGSVGDLGTHVSEFGSLSVSEIPLPNPPPKPTEVLRRASLRNSPAIHIDQLDSNRCFVCMGQDTAADPLVPVLTARAGHNHWLHRACLHQHSRRVLERVAAIAADAK